MMILRYAFPPHLPSSLNAPESRPISTRAAWQSADPRFGHLFQLADTIFASTSNNAYYRLVMPFAH